MRAAGAGSAPRSAGTATCAGSSTSGGCRTCWSTSRSAVAARRVRRSATGRSSGRRCRPRWARSRSRSWPRGSVDVAARSRAGRRSAAAPTPCASPGPAPRRSPALTGCWPCWRTWGSRRPARTIAAAMAAEATRIIGEARRRPRGAGRATCSAGCCRPRRTAPLRVLVAGSTGAMGGGQFGTALSAVQTAHHAGRAVHALVARGPARARGRADRVLGAAPGGRPARGGHRRRRARVHRRGRPRRGPRRRRPDRRQRRRRQHRRRLPARARRAGRRGPVHRVRRLRSPSTRPSPTAPRPARGGPARAGRSAAAGTRIAPEGTPVLNRLQDLTPASLVTAIVTEHGALRPPFASSIAAVLPVSEAVEMPEAAGASSTPVPPVDSASSAAEAVG